MGEETGAGDTGCLLTCKKVLGPYKLVRPQWHVPALSMVLVSVC